MLDVQISNKYVPEKKYIIDVLLSDFLGLDYKLSIFSTEDYRITLPNNNVVVIKDQFFKKYDDATGYLNAKNIPERTNTVNYPLISEKDLPIIYGRALYEENDNTIICGIDIFASCFFMLTRWEEYVSKTRDLHNRFMGRQSCAFKNNFIHRPIVNEYIDLLYSLFQKKGFNQPRRKTEFQIIPTHDIDKIYMPYHIKEYLADIYLTKKISNIFKRFKLQTSKANPFNTFSFLMALSEQYGLRSRFYFKSNVKTKYDTPYDIRSTYISTVIGNIQKNNHILGFHPGYNTYNNPVEWKKQKNDLEESLNTTLYEGRQHYLRFNIPDTWEIWESNNMTTDSTMCYSDTLGFRCGTSIPFPVFNIKSRKVYRLHEQPVVLFDRALHSYTYSADILNKIQENIIYYKNICKKYKIPLTLLFHNSSFDNIRWIKWDYIYERIFQ